MSELVSLLDERERGIARAAEVLRMGELVVAPTDTIYGLLGDAFKPWATAKIFEIKQRPRSLPLPILVSRPKQAWALCGAVPDAALKLAAAFWPGALTMVLPENPELDWDLGERTGSIAVRMPAQEDLLEIIAMVGPVAGTSANPSGAATAPDVHGVREALGDQVALYLDGGESPADTGSTIVDLTGEQPKILREGPIPAQAVLDAAGDWKAAD
ncbi:MAG TPA: L-threonylcarbamoyladenylate synthase [Actinomycetota bacterium]|nr:L-threonylcarbamoyladenylate synthase [Actinomycetota bacterium]